MYAIVFSMLYFLSSYSLINYNTRELMFARYSISTYLLYKHFEEEAAEISIFLAERKAEKALADTSCSSIVIF